VTGVRGPDPVTVAIPALNGGERLGQVLMTVRRQKLDRPLELLVADSGSRDGSRERALDHGARMLDVARGEFSHGGTRNLLMREARGTHVAFLTQDAVPAGEHWLALLLDGFALAADVALVFGPYRPRPNSSPMVRRELEEFFLSLAPDRRPRVDRGLVRGVGKLAFFTDANGCVARSAWKHVPFREVSYAEDQMLARDMLAAGYAKAYQPDAAVVHSHDYRPLDLFRRCFDEWRALREVYGHRESASPLRIGLAVQRELRDDLAFVRAEGGRPVAFVHRSLAYHLGRRLGAATGSRADRLPPRLRRAFSLEGRAGFETQRGRVA
jgi:glycosyltransferase involved in cell wall biosynthesis